jgi:hypothetical protein
MFQPVSVVAPGSSCLPPSAPKVPEKVSKLGFDTELANALLLIPANTNARYSCMPEFFFILLSPDLEK